MPRRCEQLLISFWAVEKFSELKKEINVSKKNRQNKEQWMCDPVPNRTFTSPISNVEKFEESLSKLLEVALVAVG